MTTSVKLITQGALSRFADLVYAKQNSLYKLWIVSPWIGVESDGDPPVLRMLDALKARNPSMIVVTRKPDSAWHLAAVQRLATQRNSQVYYCPDLHTKLYIAECNDFRAAILGSPNLTPAGNARNKELAVEFRALQGGLRHDVWRLIGDLRSYASDLRSLKNVTLLERGSDR
jgi:hypothetical protein